MVTLNKLPSAPPAAHTHSHDTDLTGVSANDHHNQSHDHSLSADNSDLAPESLNITGGPFKTSGVIGPFIFGSGYIGADYSPAGLADATVILVEPDASGTTIDGLAGGAQGRRIVFINTSAAGNLDFKPEGSSSSTAANRFAFGMAAAEFIRLYAGFSLELIYETSDSRWHPTELASTDNTTPGTTAAAGSAGGAGVSTFARRNHSHAHGTGYLTDAHHNQAHVLDGADHTVSGQTTGFVLRASSAVAFAFAANEGAFAMGMAGTVTASADTADFLIAVPYNFKITRLKITYKTKPTTDATIQLRSSSTGNTGTFADISSPAVFVTAGNRLQSFDITDTDVDESFALNFSVTGGGDGVNIMVELIGYTR